MTLKKYAEIYSHERDKEQGGIYSGGHNPLFYWKQIWQIIGALTGNEKEAGTQAGQAQAGGLVWPPRLAYTVNVKNMHPHQDSNLGPWNTVPML